MKAWRGEVSAPRRARLRSRVVAVVLVVFEQRVEVVRRFVLPRSARPATELVEAKDAPQHGGGRAQLWPERQYTNERRDGAAVLALAACDALD